MSSEPNRQQAEQMAREAAIKRRLDAIDAGTAKLIAWDEARRRIFANVRADDRGIMSLRSSSQS